MVVDVTADSMTDSEVVGDSQWCSLDFLQLRDRLRLLEATVSPTMVQAAGTWAMTDAIRNRLKVTQRRMIRMIMPSRCQSRSCAIFVMRPLVLCLVLKMLQCVFVTHFRSRSVDPAELRVVLLPAHRLKITIALLKEVHRARRNSDNRSHQVTSHGKC